MNDAGDILVRRYAKSNVYIKSTTSTNEEKETAIGADVLKQPNQSLEIEKVYKVSFDEGKILISGEGSLRSNEKLNLVVFLLNFLLNLNSSSTFFHFEVRIKMLKKPLKSVQNSIYSEPALLP